MWKYARTTIRIKSPALFLSLHIDASSKIITNLMLLRNIPSTSVFVLIYTETTKISYSLYV